MCIVGALAITNVAQWTTPNVLAEPAQVIWLYPHDGVGLTRFDLNRKEQSNSHRKGRKDPPTDQKNSQKTLQPARDRAPSTRED